MTGNVIHAGQSSGPASPQLRGFSRSTAIQAERAKQAQRPGVSVGQSLANYSQTHPYAVINDWLALPKDRETLVH